MHAAQSDASRAAVAATCFLLSACVAPVLAPEPSWRCFLHEMTETAKRTVRTSLSQFGHAGLARRIVEAAEDIVDPFTQRKGDNFGMLYSAVVWSAGLPPDWQYAVTTGQSRPVYNVGLGVVVIRNGARPNSGCPYQQAAPPEGEALGAFGWPCSMGGSTATVQATLDSAPRNCLLFFLPDFHGRLDSPPRRDAKFIAYTTARNVCIMRQPRLHLVRHPVKADLTTLADCLYREYPYVGSRRRGRRLRGIAVIPGHMPTGNVIGQDDLFGYSAAEGHLIVDGYAIPNSQYDVELLQSVPHPLCIYFMLAFED